MRQSPALEIGEWVLDPRAQRLVLNGEEHALEPKELAVLLHLAEEAPGCVSRDALLARGWQGVVVGENALDQVIARLRKLLGDDARHPRYIETLHRRGYRLLVPVSTLHAAGSGQHEGPLLAVLPFANLSDDARLDYFSDGVSEEILETLARTTSIRMIGRSSSFQFRGADKAARTVGDALGCSHVLDGSVRYSGSRVRVSAQLVECAQQTAVWADRFESDLSDVFALQDEIAEAIARALQMTFAPSPSSEAIDPFAYDLYLRAKASTSQWLGANEPWLLEQAVAVAPRFTQAWAALAVSRAIECAYGDQDPAPARAFAIEAANAALRLDPQCSMAYVALGIVEPMCGRFIERDALLTRALTASPNDPVALFWASRWHWAVGHLRESLSGMTRAYALESLWPQGVHQYASALWTAGEFDEAMRIWDQAMVRWPQLKYLYAAQLGFATLTQNWARAQAVIAALDASGLKAPATERARGWPALARSWTTSEQAALGELEKLRARLQRTGTVRLYLHTFCQAGFTDDVYALLERARFDHLFEPGGRLPPGEAGIHHLFTPGGEAMRRDPRFVRLCGKLGLCDYWVRTGRWPDCVEEVAPYYDFRQEAVRYLSAECPRATGC